MTATGRGTGVRALTNWAGVVVKAGVLTTYAGVGVEVGGRGVLVDFTPIRVETTFFVAVCRPIVASTGGVLVGRNLVLVGTAVRVLLATTVARRVVVGAFAASQAASSNKRSTSRTRVRMPNLLSNRFLGLLLNCFFNDWLTWLDFYRRAREGRGVAGHGLICSAISARSAVKGETILQRHKLNRNSKSARRARLSRRARPGWSGERSARRKRRCETRHSRHRDPPLRADP